jgi:hypothetical protein
VDGADESNSRLQLIKGGGGALTREKIVAAASRQFVCIADESKLVKVLGAFPLPVEVIPMARSYVARELVRLGGTPVWRDGFVTDNGNLILDVQNLEIMEPAKLEQTINNIAGVVTVGIFALRPADVLILGTPDGPKTLRAEITRENIDRGSRGKTGTEQQQARHPERARGGCIAGAGTQPFRRVLAKRINAAAGERIEWPRKPARAPSIPQIKTKKRGLAAPSSHPSDRLQH